MSHPPLPPRRGLGCDNLSGLSQSHWKAAKKVLRYLQVTKDPMLTYRHTDTLELLVLVIPIMQVA